MSPTVMPPASYDARFLHGVSLFNAGEFFAAHEVWEDLWREASGQEKQFYQGLIQCAVALEHARRGNVRGALRLAERYPRRFAGVQPVFMGLNVGDFLARMETAMQRLREAGANGLGGIDAAAILPRIELAPTTTPSSSRAGGR
jgi:hypothetical protein